MVESFPRLAMRRFVLLAMATFCCWVGYAGGSGLNTIIVINQQNLDSLALGNYYAEKRQVPPENILRINWTGGPIAWSEAQFLETLQAPLEARITAANLSNQIDCVALSMGIPFQIISPSATNSTHGSPVLRHKDQCQWHPQPGITNSYAASEQIFSHSRPTSAPTGTKSYLATMITGSTLAEAMQLVNQGSSADASFPTQPIILAKTSDPDRNIRHPYFDNAILNNRVLAKTTVLRTNTTSPPNQTALLGYATGMKSFEVAPSTFTSGAIADNVTSFGGIIFGPNDQTNLLAFITAGAAGSYGTVTEPGSIAKKFPDPQVYFYQARGFNIAESYYQSLAQPHLGLVVAEPLAAPFTRAGSGHWVGGISNSILTQTASLSVQFKATTITQPLQQLDLFVDGKYFVTVTNLPPRPQDTLHLRLNGYPLDFPISTNATLASVAQGLAALINTATVTNVVKIQASARGDRIEFQSTATNHTSFPFFTASPTAGTTSDFFRLDYLTDSVPPRLLNSALGPGSDLSHAVGISHLAALRPPSLHQPDSLAAAFHQHLRWFADLLRS
ncbi:MAG: TIGR03790 family protein [Verrucomicrobiota bacterium]